MKRFPQVTGVGRPDRWLVIFRRIIDLKRVEQEFSIEVGDGL